MAWIFWLGLLAIVTLIFIWLWKLAARIERDEIEEQQWLQYIDQVRQMDPYEAARWQELFNQRFK